MIFACFIIDGELFCPTCAAKQDDVFKGPILAGAVWDTVQYCQECNCELNLTIEPDQEEDFYIGSLDAF